ncbi:Transcriptional regulator of nonfermentable carbon utilization [Coemansia asiatica]|nr:Transcriptional regulator of nonfermentable carbon utilization [Coemansia asiatica]
MAQMAVFSQSSPSPAIIAAGISGMSAPGPVAITATGSASASVSTSTSASVPTGLQAAPTALNFGSEAINLEYAFLSSMFSYPLFNNASAALPAPSDAADLASATNSQHQPLLTANSTISIPNSLWAPSLQTQPPTSSSTQSQIQSQGQLPSLVPSQSQSQSQSRLAQQHRPQMAAAATSSSLSPAANNIMPRQDSWQGQNQSQSLVQQQQFSGGAPLVRPSPPPHAQILGDDTHNPLSRPPTSGPAVYGLNPVYPQSPAQVYSSVTEPYKYYNGFHFFFRHICGRMGKRDIMRISRAIAHFRPSLVAQLRNLTYEDLIFMEKSFQRALMEYEKLIGFIGTPTVVWRRSGEIALVGKEFSILTHWDRQLLMAGNRFIFELMDTSSAVVYWEQFAEHAFENSEHSVMSECCLVRPDGVAVPCAFSFTIKRDLFGIPMAIIGNFLPVL